MKKSKVAIIRCESYDEQVVLNSVRKGIDLIGGIDKFVKKDEKIVLKPNVLTGDIPEKQISTHPSVLKAVGKIVKEITDKVTYGDSPGFGKPITQMKKALLEDAANELGIPFADFDNGKEIRFKDSPFTKQFVISNGVLEADGLISLSKMKSHGLTRMTGAVKNQFGCIPGILKAEYHVKMVNVIEFAKALVALTLLLKPRLYIMDAIMAMEGNGPRNGTPVKMNALLFSDDPIALDSVMCKLVDINPEFVPTMKPGKEWGLGTYLYDEIEIVGDDIEPLINKNFKVERKPVEAVTSSGMVSFVKNLVSQRPVINKDKCVKCGVCITVCPVKEKAVNWKNNDKKSPPVHNYKICIRCYCCQELCPENAITIKTPLLGKLIHQ